MVRHLIASATFAAALLAATSIHAEEFSAKFSGFNEVGALNAETGAILSEGTATLHLNLNRAAQTLKFTLTFAGLSSPVTQAHIHFGKVHVPGGVIVFFCSNVAAPTGTQTCPANGGTVTGTITAANVIGPAGQNIPAGSFDGLEDALESNTAYGNIHTTNFPAGEIRGEIRSGDRDDDR